MIGPLKKLIAVFILLLTLVGFYNYQHQFSLSDVNTPILVLFVAVMAALIWKLGPLLGNNSNHEDDLEDIDIKSDLSILKTASFSPRVKSTRISYKTLGTISLGFLFFILSLSLFGFYHLYQLGKERQQNDLAALAINRIELLNQEIRTDIVLLTASPADSLNRKYLGELINLIGNAKQSKEQFSQIVHNSNEATIQMLFNQLSPLINTSLDLASKLIAGSPVSGNYSYSKAYITEYEKLNEKILPLIRKISGQYRQIDKDNDRDLVIANIVLFVFLIIALILITAIVLMPVLRNGSKTYSELQVLLQASKKSEAMLRTIINSTPDLIFVKDKFHRYQIVNQAFADQSNSTIEAYINKTDLEIGLPEDVVYGNPAKGVKGFWTDDNEVMASGQTRIEKELSVRVKDWEKIVTTVKVPLKDEAGKVWGILSFVHDITELKRTEEELRKIHQLLDAVAKATYELISDNDLDVAMGKATRLLGVNLRVDKVNIYKNLSIDGTRFSKQLVNWNGLDNSIEYNATEFQRVPTHAMTRVMETLEKNEVYFSSVDEMEKNKGQQWFKNKAIKSLAAFPVFVMKNFWGFVSFNDFKNNRDWQGFELSILRAFASTLGAVIERREIEHQLTSARDVAELANKAKTEFMANMSHELLTPMNGIIGFNQLLLATTLNDDQHDYSLNISKSANNLLFIINDILDLLQIQQGKLVIEKTVFSLAGIIKEITDEVLPKVTDKNLVLNLDIENNLPLEFEGDPLRIKQIVYNLVTNAIKFTEVGNILVKIKKAGEIYYRGTQKFLRVVITVSDTGIGINANEFDKIFERFTQADSSITRKYGGNGLGLNISKHLAELMGGKLEVSSQLGEGSTFELKLGLRIIRQAEIIEKPENGLANLNSLTQPERVLVVEDDLMNLTLISEVLRKMNVDVVSASNGKEALDRVFTYSPALIFMDVNMPVMDGITSTRLIRKMPSPYCSIPIIALSADTMKDDIENCLKSGMNSFISKPFKLKEITEALKEYIQTVKG